MFGMGRTQLLGPSFLMFRISRPIARMSSISSYVPGPSQWFFHFGEDIVIASTQEKTRTPCAQNPIILHDNVRSHIAAAVTDLLRRWQWETLEHPPYSPDSSPCDYDLFSKVKEPLRGTWNNTRYELIRAIGRSYGTTTKMDALMVYDAFQTLDKR